MRYSGLARDPSWTPIHSLRDDDAERRALHILTNAGGRDVHVHEFERDWTLKDRPLSDVQFDPFLCGPGTLEKPVSCCILISRLSIWAPRIRLERPCWPSVTGCTPKPSGNANLKPTC